LLNHLTLPDILDITTNPPNDSVKRGESLQSFRATWVKACEPDALFGGAIRNHNQQKNAC
jgi:hypothetical protein